MGMSKEHRDALINNRSYIVKNLKLSGVFSAVMREGNIITEEFEDEIMSKTTKNGRNAEFLDILARRGPYAFDQFIKALVETDQTEIIKKIDPDPKPHYDWRKIVEIIVRERSALIDIEYLKKKTPYKNRGHSEPEYPKNADQTGRAVIINIKHFKDESCSTRNGSEMDVNNLCKMFELMKYDITTFGNVGNNEKFVLEKDFMEFLSTEQKYLETNGFKYFVWFMVIMSHGEESCFLTSDSAKILFQNVLVRFDGHNCKSLISVPKIFIFQCCRGEARSRGVSMASDGKSGSRVSYESDAIFYPKLEPELNVHEKADLFEAYSTPEGYSSWRMTELGSWFIRAIVHVFSTFCRHEDFQTMMTKVNEVVSGLKTDTLNIQQPIFVNTLKRKLYLL